MRPSSTVSLSTQGQEFVADRINSLQLIFLGLRIAACNISFEVLDNRLESLVKSFHDFLFPAKKQEIIRDLEDNFFLGYYTTVGAFGRRPFGALKGDAK